MNAKQTEVFNQVSATFSAATIKKWESIITTWEANLKAQNPYAETGCGKHLSSHFFFLEANFMIVTTLQDVWLALAKEDTAQVALGNLPWHKMSLSAFLITGFELEDSQYIIYIILWDISFDLRIFSDILFVMKHPSWKGWRPANSWWIFKINAMCCSTSGKCTSSPGYPRTSLDGSRCFRDTKTPKIQSYWSCSQSKVKNVDFLEPSWEHPGTS